MRNLTIKMMAALCCLFMAMTLSACGGGGSSGGVAPPPVGGGSGNTVNDQLGGGTFFGENGGREAARGIVTTRANSVATLSSDGEGRSITEGEIISATGSRVMESGVAGAAAAALLQSDTINGISAQHGPTCGVGESVSAGQTCRYQGGGNSFDFSVRDDGRGCLGSSICAGNGLTINGFRATRSGNTWTIVAIPTGAMEIHGDQPAPQQPDPPQQPQAPTAPMAGNIFRPTSGLVSPNLNLQAGGAIRGLMGELNGFLGALTCADTAADCRIVTEDNRITAIAGAWTFTPTISAPRPSTEAAEVDIDMSDLSPHDGTGGGLSRREELLFLFEEQNGALIRSEDGNRYLFLTLQEQTAAGTALDPQIVHILDFQTDRSPAAVNEAVSDMRTVVNSHAAGTALEANPPAIKGARDDLSTWITDADSNGIATGLEIYTTDAYIFETEYSALALWVEDPDIFFDNAVWTDAEAGMIHFGLDTTAANVPSSDAATYSGVAGGVYLRNDSTSGGNRFLVGGPVMLNANFATNVGISGTAVLNAYDPAAASIASAGIVTVILANPDTGTSSNIEGADFSGAASVMGTPTANEAFADLGSNVVTAESTFKGFFTGPAAQEAVGGVHVETSSSSTGGADFLEFGFLTRQDP